MADQRLGTILGHLKATGTTPHAAETGSIPTPSSKKYRYSLDQSARSVLSEEQRDFFEENGFLVVKALVSNHDLDMYRERFRKICTREVQVRQHGLYKVSSSSISPVCAILVN